jgi:predicted nucleotidyltransferase
MVKTVFVRRVETRTRLHDAVRHLCRDLSRYTETESGAFYLFGSFARGDFCDDSDVDILVDFPETGRAHAMDFAETACLRYDLKPDIRPAQWVSSRFAQCVRLEGQKL